MKTVCIIKYRYLNEDGSYFIRYGIASICISVEDSEIYQQVYDLNEHEGPTFHDFFWKPVDCIWGWAESTKY